MIVNTHSGKTICLRTHYLTTGNMYVVTIYGKSYFCKFIKTTRTGYNFLNVYTNECVLYRSIYKVKDSKNKFNIISDINLSVLSTGTA